jgi:hypothetical protein
VIAVGPCWNIQAIGWLRPRQLHVGGGGMKLKRASIVVTRVVIGAAVAGGLDDNDRIERRFQSRAVACEAQQ